MKQALILCSGKATRLRPYSHALPKASMPFLNLPLLSLSWFYMEQLAVSHFLLNAHLFPKKLGRTVQFISQAHQKVDILPEAECLGGAGALYKLKKLLQKEKVFFYINGDSLFFPSKKDQLSFFEKDFFKTQADGSFFVSPVPDKNFKRGALWCDKDLNLKFIGAKRSLSAEHRSLQPFHFSGLALFKSELLETLNYNSVHLFDDFVNPLLVKNNFKVFVDEKAQILEGGEIPAYLSATKFCLNALSNKGQGKLKKLLLEYFNRFDPEDKTVGLGNGQAQSKKLGYPLLAPKSVNGLENLTLKGPAVLGAEVNFFEESQLSNTVLGPSVSWRGKLEHEIVLKFCSDN